MVYTIPSAFPWPTNLERERSLSWIPDFQNEAGPPALDGTRQYRNTNGGGLWRSSFNGVQITRREFRLAWRATEISLRGGMTPVVVPCCADRPEAVTGSVVNIVSVDGWAARAVSGRIDLVDSTEIEAGMYFSDDDPVTYGKRLHCIESVSHPGSPGTATQRDITFWPPARFAVPATGSHSLNFSDPGCVMQLVSSDSMDMELEQRKRGNPSAEFIEAF